MGQDRNNRGSCADRIEPDTVMGVIAARDDAARPMTATNVVGGLGIARQTAHNKLNALVERETLDTRKAGASGQIWWIPDGRETPETAARANVVDDVLERWHQSTEIDPAVTRAQTHRAAQYLLTTGDRLRRADLVNALANGNTLDADSCSILDIHCSVHWPHDTQTGRRVALRNTKE